MQARAGKRPRDRERERILSRLCTDSTEPDAGLELTDRKIVTWPEVGCLTHWASQAPQESDVQLIKPPRRPQLFLRHNWHITLCRSLRYTSFSFFFLMFVYFERETEHSWGQGRERGRHRIWSRHQAELSAQSQMQGLNSRAVQSWPELKSDTQLTEPPRCPYFVRLILKLIPLFLFFTSD